MFGDKYDMFFSKAKREFDIRYYVWAISQFEKEIEEGFPIMRLFKSGSAWKTYNFMQQLARNDQLILARGLLKRFHSTAIQALGETCSPEEESLRWRRDEAPRAPMMNSPGEKCAGKKKLLKAVMAKFQKAFGNQCVGQKTDDYEPTLEFDMKISGWIVSTHFYFGRRETLLNYSHSIGSEKTFPCRRGEIAMVLGCYMSFNSWLGIASQTEWPDLRNEEIEPSCDAAIKLCGHFFEVLPKLLKGLECETVIPDEGYELMDNPLR